MARGRSGVRLKMSGSPAVSSVAIVFGLALVALALLSILSGRLLEADTARVRKSPTRSSDGVKKLLEALRSVPGEGDLTWINVWKSENAESYYGCTDASPQFEAASLLPKSNGYLMIEASGGLNQQRTGITDAVVVARILNATLVVPYLDHKSFWHDNSNFSDIFDVKRFISVLAPDVTIVKELPRRIRERNKSIYSMRVPRKCTPHYYESRVLPLLLKKEVVQLTKFDYRLTNKLDTDLQKLRCRVNYNALSFTKPISEMGQSLVESMRSKGGRYIALHLRFEPDMLAFSGCYYGGGDKEIKDLGAIRKRWKALHTTNPDRGRRNGKCPLTPTEVGLMLRALGYGNDTNLYVASGDVYGGEETLAPLKALFPNFFTKEILASKSELQQFSHFSSRMAAIDYIVCDQSDVFVANNNGNMARILAGQRRYSGHKRTIRPNSKKLWQLFLSRETIGWVQFATKLRHLQVGFMGDPKELRPGRGEFHENPAACICESSPADKVMDLLGRNHRTKSQDGSKRQDQSLSEPDEESDVGIDSEDDIVQTEFVAGEGLDEAKEEAMVEEMEVEEIPFLSD